MSEAISILSNKGPYQVQFASSVTAVVSQIPIDKKNFFIIDQKVSQLYGAQFAEFRTQTVSINANETTKSLHSLTEIISNLLEIGMRNGDRLIAVGGGITQDITAFLASVLYRGVAWSFIPTTLLAQADSCIGSKSSINVAGYKNLLGSFCPPEKIWIATDFLNTLKKEDLHSGIGEIIKVHIIDSYESFKSVERDYPQFFTQPELLKSYIEKSLNIKKKFIELDEFDKNVRNILNYGHSFGHAIESATNFAVPHGIAVGIGMDMANYTAYRLGRWSKEQYLKYHPLLKQNSIQFYNETVDFDIFIAAIANDKKNSNQHLNLILPNSEQRLEKTAVVNGPEFQNICREFLNDRK